MGRKRWAELAVLPLLAGCPSISTHLVPRPTPVGVTEIYANVDGVAAPRANDPKMVNYPNIELSARHGLGTFADVGVKANVFGLEVNSRLALILSDGFDLSVVPGLGVHWSQLVLDDAHPTTFNGIAEMPLLAGVPLGKRVLLVGGAKMGLMWVPDAASLGTTVGSMTLMPGGVIGTEIRFSDVFALFPELNVVTPYNFDTRRFERPIWQGGVGLRFRLLR